MAQIRISGMCALWPWPWSYDLGSRHDPPFESWTTIVWNIIQIQHGSEELWPKHWFCVKVHCDLGLGNMTLGQGHDTPLGHGQQLCEILSRSNMAVKSYGPDTHILLCVHFYLDLGGMTLGQGHDTPLGHGQQLCEILSRFNMAVRSYCPDTDFGYVCTVTLTLEIWPLVKVMTHPWVMDNNCVKYYPDPTWQWGVMARTRNLGMCALWPWPWRLTLGQSHDTPLGHGQQLCEILSRYNMAVRSYCPDTDFGYVCTVTLTLEIWPLVKVMTHPRVMDNNCVKYYPDPTWQWGVIDRTRILGMCALWPWPWRYDLGSRSWHILGSLTIIVWNII